MLIHRTDSYKASQYLQYPEIQYAQNYMEARTKDERLKFIGIQMILMKNFMEVPTHALVDEIGKLWVQHGEPFNFEGWHKIVDLGFYPLRIHAKKEGTIVSSLEPLVTVVNTLPGFEWLCGWAEDVIMHLWYPISVATKSWRFKKTIQYYLTETGSDAPDFKLHDFGYRGCTCNEQASIGGLAHLTNFSGTDTFPAIMAARKYYGADMVGFSIPAAEHSTITSWGREREVDAYRNMIKRFGGEGKMYAAPFDSYDMTNAVTNILGKELKDEVLRAKGTFIVRPDSGEPVDVVLRTLKECEDAFGCTKNDKGYKVLNPAIRLIQGDNINEPDDVATILDAMHKRFYSADNIAFGAGGGLLQKVNRDTHKFAIKLCATHTGVIGEEWKGQNKCPKDAPWKQSRKGYQWIKDGECVFMEGSLENKKTWEDIV